LEAARQMGFQHQASQMDFQHQAEVHRNHSVEVEEETSWRREIVEAELKVRLPVEAAEVHRRDLGRKEAAEGPSEEERRRGFHPEALRTIEGERHTTEVGLRN
jgi:RNA polymerase-interacting CarD/CdnL/TRCF family regulator